MPSFMVGADLLDACGQPGCPVCRLAQQSVRHSLNSLYYEKVNNVELRQRLRDALGFCRTHAWLAFEPGVGDVLGGAIIYDDIFKNVLRALDAPQGGSGGGLSGLLGGRRSAGRARSLAAALKPRDHCLACEWQAQADEMYLSDLINLLGKENTARQVAGSQGLCLAHFIQAVERAPDDAVLDRLLDLQRRRLGDLQAELAELIRKFDHRFSREAHGGERDALRRALRLGAGEPPFDEKQNP